MIFISGIYSSVIRTLFNLTAEARPDSVSTIAAVATAALVVGGGAYLCCRTRGARLAAQPILALPPQDVTSRLDAFQDNIKCLAPTINRAISCTIAGNQYFVWWNESTKSLNIQESAAFLTRSSNQKFGIAVRDVDGAQTISYFVNGRPSRQGISANQQQILPALIGQITQMRERHDQAEALRNIFDPQCLSVLSHFMGGPLGAPYRYNPSSAAQSPELLYLGEHPSMLCAWLRVEDPVQEQPIVRGRGGALLTQHANQPPRYIVNLQTAQAYRDSWPTDKLGIGLDQSGRIISLFQDGHLVAQQDVQHTLFAPGAVWNQRLTNAIQMFLINHAVRNTPGQIAVHSSVLAHQPEAVLQRLADLPGFPHVSYLRDDLTPGPGTDAGGLRNQLMTDLFQSLLDGASKRLIKVDSSSGLPQLSTLDAEELRRQSIALQNLGKMLVKCLQNQAPITGRVLPDSFFSLVQALFAMPMHTPITDARILNLVPTIIHSDLRWMLEIYEGRRAPSAQERVNLGADVLALITDSDSIEQIRAAVGQHLVATYRPIIQAGEQVVQGMRSAGLPGPLILGRPPAQISEQIQGRPFNRAEIVSRLRCNSASPVVIQKYQWLKEFILDSEHFSQEWVEKVMFTIAAQRALKADTILTIDESAGNNCIAHTCFKTLEVPNTHTSQGTDVGQVADDRQKFLNNLTLTMSQSNFDMS